MKDNHYQTYGNKDLLREYYEQLYDNTWNGQKPRKTLNKN